MSVQFARRSPRQVTQPRACISVMELENFEDALEALIASGAEHYGDCDSMERLHSL